MPHPRRPSVRLLTRRQFTRRQEPHRRRGRGARRNPLRRGVDRARRRAVALSGCALVLTAAAAVGAARLLPGRLVAEPYRAIDGPLLGLSVFAVGAAAVVVALHRWLQVLERRAAESWERSWRRVEPLWSGRALPWRVDGDG